MLFVYYNTRSIEGTVASDSGASITDAVKSLNRFGVPGVEDWPYDISKFTVEPPPKAYTDGLTRQAVKYARVNQTISEMKACLTAGLPIVIGFTVYDSFESDAVAATGDVPMPNSTGQVLGGHCVTVVGYTVRNGVPVWICRNSWGPGWGDKGYFYFPEAYLTNPDLANDFWTVQTVSSPDPAPVPPKPEPAPVPTPTPAPPIDEIDAALWHLVGDWAKARHYLAAKTTAKAILLWARARGLN